MGLYTEPRPNAYALGQIFDFPTSSGSTRAIAVSSEAGQILTSLFSVLLTLAFIAAWKLASLICYYLWHEDVRYLVEQSESGDVARFITSFITIPWTVPSASPKQTQNPEGNHAKRRVGLFLFSVSFFIASVAAGILVPALLIIGSAAPAQPDAVYFPEEPTTRGGAEGLKYQALKAPAAMRAVGAAQAGLADSVSVNMRPIPAGEKPILQVDYSYEITGRDFGLQKLSGLVQTVKGSCITEYDWLTDHNDMGDYYTLWGMANQTVAVYATEAINPPWATMHLHPNTAYSSYTTGNNSYAILVHSAGRTSYTASSDPWYTTYVPIGSNQTRNGGPNEVLSGRPALSCWQKDSWSFKGQVVESVFHLSDLKGLDLPPSWDDFLRGQFVAPKILDIGISLDCATLVSATTHLNQVFDAQSSSLFVDMQRLIRTAFVASRDIFKESTMVTERYNIANAATNPQGRPKDRVAEFVLTTSVVSTLSIPVLVTVPVIFLVLCVLAAIPWPYKTRQRERRINP
ncbi:hypothetical protein SAMD00023353_0601470 [Rosellinia necatrix]|uniref:Uncharacterized protein n=1 Tax=Rosellinia necatrix TaxID=77044 RepID=A0A1S7UL97_ROSNE|nr:hypothetical protein SAMD00023353_0601470 [Rosellinia necatrix]